MDDGFEAILTNAADRSNGSYPNAVAINHEISSENTISDRRIVVHIRGRHKTSGHKYAIRLE